MTSKDGGGSLSLPIYLYIYLPIYFYLYLTLLSLLFSISLFIPFHFVWAGSMLPKNVAEGGVEDFQADLDFLFGYGQGRDEAHDFENRGG